MVRGARALEALDGRAGAGGGQLCLTPRLSLDPKCSLSKSGFLFLSCLRGGLRSKDTARFATLEKSLRPWRLASQGLPGRGAGECSEPWLCFSDLSSRSCSE